MALRKSSPKQEDLKVLLIDHDDSFTDILARYVENATGEFPIIKNHRKTSVAEIKKLRPSHIILSPGPGNPSLPADKKTNPKTNPDFSIGHAILKNFHLPILGVCLGHQGIAAYFGAKITHAPEPRHGKKSQITHDKKGLFKGIPSPLTVMRYHSLCVVNLPTELEVTSTSEDELIMSFAHKTLPIFGVQFHPESIATEQGQKIIENFFAITKSARSGKLMESPRI